MTEVEGTEKRDLAERLDVVEALLADSAEEHELAESIANMGFSARELASAITKIEKSQRELLELKKQARDLKDSKADSVDVEAIRLRHQSEIARIKGWTFSVAIIAAALLGATIFFFSMYNKAKTDAQVEYQRSVLSICKQREQQSATVRKFLDMQAESIKAARNATNEEIANAQQQLDILRDAFPAIDCGQLLTR